MDAGDRTDGHPPCVMGDDFNSGTYGSFGNPRSTCYLLNLQLMIRSYQGIAPRISQSCYIDESAQIIGDVEIGENSSVWMNAVIRGDVYAIRIGNNSNVQDCSVLHGMRHKYGVRSEEHTSELQSRQ